MVSVSVWKPRTGALFWHAAGRGAGRNSPSVPSASRTVERQRITGFPKRVRLLRSSDFRKVYDGGRKFTCPYFAAFCAAGPDGQGPRVGFTTPRALGKAVVRNRIRRRVREAVRLQLDRLNSQWSIVINPRRKALEAPFAELEREVERLFRHCNGE